MSSCHVKIVATIGPKTDNDDVLRALYEAGMNVARLNGSHATKEWHANAIDRIRKVLPEVAVLLDIPGSKIRTGHLVNEPYFAPGDRVVFTGDVREDGNGKVPVTFPDFHEVVSVGEILLADDGSLSFSVTGIEGRDVVCRADRAGVLKSSKGLGVPQAHRLRDGTLSERDQETLLFARETGVDFVGISYVEKASQIEAVRTLVGEDGPRVVAKIETQPAVDQLSEILEASDALMIDRGDLSVETELERITLLQKHILQAALLHPRPVIVATEMLHSMIDNPSPTRAEISDISNAVLDGAAALMLSGETAVGEFPVEAVAIMRRTAERVSQEMQRKLDHDDNLVRDSVPMAMQEAVSLICRRLPVTKIVAITISGYAARMVSAGMPRQPILAVSNNAAAARSFNLLRGTEGVFVDVPFTRKSTDHIPICLEALWKKGKLIDDDLVLVTAVGYPQSGNRMNLIETHKVSDLRENLGW